MASTHLGRFRTVAGHGEVSQVLPYAFALFYVVVPLSIVIYGIVRVIGPTRVTSTIEKSDAPFILGLASKLAPSTIVSFFRSRRSPDQVDVVATLQAAALQPTDAIASYALASLRLAHSALDTATLSIALSRRIDRRLSTLVRRSAQALHDRDKATLYIALARILSLSLRRRLSSALPQPERPRGATNAQLLEEMSALSTLLNAPRSEAEFFTRLTRWQETSRWLDASPRLLPALRHISQRFTNPSQSPASTASTERQTLGHDRMTISRLASDVVAALESEDYAKVMDLLSEDFQRRSPPGERHPHTLEPTQPYPPRH